MGIFILNNNYLQTTTLFYINKYTLVKSKFLLKI